MTQLGTFTYKYFSGISYNAEFSISAVGDGVELSKDNMPSAASDAQSTVFWETDDINFKATMV
jgi:hypothetical protein